jgi:hypothetical protein
MGPILDAWLRRRPSGKCQGVFERYGLLSRAVVRSRIGVVGALAVLPALLDVADAQGAAFALSVLTLPAIGVADTVSVLRERSRGR